MGGASASAGAKKIATLTQKIVFKGQDRTKGAINSVERNIKRVGTAIGAVTAAVSTGFLVGAIKSAADFEQQMKRVQGVSGATGKDLDNLRKIAEELGATTRFTATQAAEGLEELARAGQSAEQAIATVPNALRLAQANAIELADAAQLVTTTLNQYALAANESTRVSDVLTRTTQLSAQNIEELGKALEFAGPQARLVGLSLEETTAVIGKLADVGFRGEKGGTALRNALIELDNPASNFNKTLADLGIESTNFIDVLEELEAQGADANQAFIDLGKRAGPAIASLVSNGVGNIRELTSSLDDAAGTAEETARIMDDNLTGATLGLQSAFDALRRAVVDPILQPLTTEVQTLSGELRQLVTDGSAAEFGEKLRDVFENAAIAARALASELDLIIPILATLTGAALFLAGPIGKLITLLGSATTGLVFFREESAAVADALADLAEKFSSDDFTFNPITNSATILGLNDDLKETSASLRAFAQRLRESERAATPLERSLGKIKGTIGEGINKALTKGQSLWQRVTGEVNKFVQGAQAAAESTKKVTEEQRKFAEGVSSLVDDLFSYDTQMKVLTAAQELVNQRFDDGTLALSDYLAAVNALDDQIATLQGTLGDAGDELEEINLDLLPKKLEEFGDSWEDAATRAGDAWSAFLDFLPRGISGAIRSVTGGFQGISQGLGNLFFGQRGTQNSAGTAGIFGGLFGFGGRASGFTQGLGAIGGALGVGQALGGGVLGGAAAGGLASISVGAPIAASLGAGSLITALGGFAIPLIGTAIGAIVGGLVDRFSDNPDPRIRLTNNLVNQGGFRMDEQQFRRNSAFGFTIVGQQITETFGAENAGAFLDAVQEFDQSIANLLNPEQIERVFQAFVPGGNTETSTLFEGDISIEQALSQRFDTIVGALGGRIEEFVGQFSGDLETGVEALQAILNVTKLLDADPLEAVAEALERADEGTLDTLGRLSEELTGLADVAFDSVEGMNALGVGLQQYNRFVAESLLGIEAARQAVGDITTGTIDQLTFQTLDQDGQFNFLGRRANDISAGISGLGSAEQVQAALAQVNSLAAQQFGLLSEDEQRRRLPEFEAALRSAEADAQARLDVLEAEIRAQAEADRDALAAAVGGAVAQGNEDSGIVAAGTVINGAGQVIASAAKTFSDGVNTLVSTPLSVSFEAGEIGA